MFEKDFLKKSLLLLFIFSLVSCGGGGGGGSPGTTPPPSGGPGPTPIGGTPELIENDAVNSARTLVTAGNAAGRVVAVWGVITGAVTMELWSNIFEPGTGWGTEKQIAGSEIISHVEVAIDEAGTPIAIWRVNNILKASTYSGTSWSAAVELTNDAGSVPHIVADNSSNSSAFVVWKGTDNEVYTRNYISGSSWEPAVTVPQELIGEMSAPTPSNPLIGVDSSGNSYVVWYANQTYRSNQFMVGAGWSGAMEVGPSASAFAYLDVGPSGHAMLAWWEIQAGTSTQHVMGSVLSGGAWSTPESITTFSGLIMNPLQPYIDVNGDGILIWEEVQSKPMSASYEDGGTGWGSPIELPTAASLSEPVDLTANSNGDIAAIWTEDGRVYGSLFDMGSWTTPAWLLVERRAVTPKASITNTAGILVWLEQNVAVANVWSSAWTL